MKTTIGLRILFLLFAAAAGAETVSTGSRHFVVESSSLTLATKAANRAEIIRQRLYALIGQSDHFISKIRIDFEDSHLGDDMDDYEFVPSAVLGNSGWEYCVRATKNPAEGDFTVPWSEAVVTVLSYELANRVRGKNPGSLITWPPWFLWGTISLADQGLQEKMEDLWETKYRRRTYRTLRQIWQTPHSAREEESERIHVLSARLILQLKQLPEGNGKMAKLAHSINRGEFTPEVFFKIYESDFSTSEAGERWWTQWQAYYNHRPELASIDLTGTKSKILDILDGGLPEPGIKGLDQQGMDELNELESELYHLMVVGHPMARPAAEAAVNALEATRSNNMRRARPAWDNARTIVEALVPWKNEIDAVLDRVEYETEAQSSSEWLRKKGLTD